MDAFHAALTRVILGGPLKHKSIVSRLNIALRRRVPKRIIGNFAREIFRQLTSQKRDAVEKELLSIVVSFDETKTLLSHYLQAGNIYHRYEALDESKLLNAKPSPAELRVSKWNLPELSNLEELAEWLEIELDQLDWLSGRIRHRHGIDSRYHCRLERNDRKVRLLEVPCLRLKRIQRHLLDGLINRIPVHDAAHGFRSGRSVISYVQPHVQQAVVWRTDLANFFLSIPRARVYGLFRMLNYSETVAGTLANLVTNRVERNFLFEAKSELPQDTFRELDRLLTNRHLPQGAPTSPAVANAVSYKLDCRLSGLAKAFGANYTRYADDLAFSGSHRFKRNLKPFREYALAIIMQEGFAIRRRKSIVMPQSQQQSLGGLVVNAKPNVPRKEYKRLHAFLHNCAVHGPSTQNHENISNLNEHLSGKIAYIQSTNQNRGDHLRKLFDAIDWSR